MQWARTISCCIKLQYNPIREPEPFIWSFPFSLSCCVYIQAPASCTFNTTPQRRASSKFRALSGRAVAQTQYHATCKDYADKIQKDIEESNLHLLDIRQWPDEFTWSGEYLLELPRPLLRSYIEVVVCRRFLPYP
jgi:hypothetical protein